MFPRMMLVSAKTLCIIQWEKKYKFLYFSKTREDGAECVPSPLISHLRMLRFPLAFSRLFLASYTQANRWIDLKNKRME